MKQSSASLLFAITFALSGVAFSQNQVDYGLLEGRFLNEGDIVANNQGLFELGTFAGYSDGVGAGYFTGKDYSTLRSSFNLFPSSTTAVQLDGQIYQTVDLLGTAGGTRLFAWVFSTTTATPSSNWTIVSGVVGGTSSYDAAWLAAAPGDPVFNYIELGTTNNFMYANSNPGNSLLPNATFNAEGADISVVPEPSAISLIALSGAALASWRARRRWISRKA
jgi:hypothetical protein